MPCDEPLRLDAVAAGAGLELAVGGGQDLSAAGAAPLDEHAAQVAAVVIDRAGAEDRPGPTLMKRFSSTRASQRVCSAR